jgi:alkanesulfonate monooxygenase SsuD/methylene tetrahydromethanopterin reductase-like flavin-dependent oxidoreductase (luciferase family)
MHAGLYLNPQTRGPQDDHAIIEAVIDHTRLAERVGFRAVWATEHAFTGYNAYSDPIVLGSHLTGVAPSLHVGFSVAVGPLHHPIRFATQVALLDNLTNGKTIAGVGTGIGPDEYAGYGLDAKDRHRLFDAWAEIVLGAWQHQGPEPFVFDTPWWKGKMDGRIIPASVQKPFPLFARATLTPEFCRKWGRMAQPLLLSLTAGHGELLWNHYLDGIDESDAPDEQKRRALEWSCFTQQTHVSDAADPVAEVWEYSKFYLHKGVRANMGYDWAAPDEWEKRKANYRRGTMLAGSPQQVLDKLAPWAERGLGHVMIWAYFGAMPPALAAETIQRFGEEVIPHLERIRPASPSRAPVGPGAEAVRPTILAP